MEESVYIERDHHLDLVEESVHGSTITWTLVGTPLSLVTQLYLVVQEESVQHPAAV